MDVSPWHLIPLLTLAALLTSSLLDHPWQLLACYGLLFLAYKQADIPPSLLHNADSFNQHLNQEALETHDLYVPGGFRTSLQAKAAGTLRGAVSEGQHKSDCLHLRSITCPEYIATGRSSTNSSLQTRCPSCRCKAWRPATRPR